MPRNRSIQLSRRQLIKGTAAASATLLLGKPAIAKGKTEIVIGNIDAYSGPAAVYSSIGRTPGGYFKMINEQGGINGRMIKYITYDDAYSPAKTVEQARKLVESDEIDVLFAPLGAPTNAAIMKYMNQKKVPHLFIASGATKFGDYKNFPYTMGFQPCYQIEGRAFAQHVLSTQTDPKIGIVYQNDDFGRDFLGPFKKVLTDAGGKAQVIMEQTYDLTDPTVDSQLINLSKSGADVFYNITTGKATSQSIRKVAELGWKPLQLLSAGSTGRSILSAAGLENAKDIVAIRYNKEVGVPRYEKDADVMAFEELRKKYLPNVDPDNTIAFAGYGQAATMGEILRRCGDDLTRANVLKHATTLAGFHSPYFLDGINYSYTPDDYTPMKTLYISIFNGKDWDLAGEPMTE